MCIASKQGSFSFKMMTEVAQRVILDVDVGTDDFLAIMVFFYAMKLGMVKIEAITCSTGNAAVDDVVRNVARLLEIVGTKEIPVYKGSLHPIVLPTIDLPPYHGKDGFGDLSYDHDPDMSVVRDLPSAVALHDIVTKHPNEVTIIALAPLTNILLASKLYDDFLPKVKDIWIMGGNYKGVGNAYGNAEYNFWVDPEAAYNVFQNSSHLLKVLPWETCLLSNITMDWRFNVLAKINNEALKLLTKVEKKYYNPDKKFWVTCDPYLASAYLFPNQTIVEQNNYAATLELHGAWTRGEVVIDYQNKVATPNIRIIEDIDFEFFKNLLIHVFEP